MAKAIKKVSKENDEQKVVVSEISEESLKYLSKLEKEEMYPTFGSKSVEQWHKDYLSGNFVVNHKYQRKPNQWSKYLKQLFLVTLFEHGIIPPLVIADLSLIDPTKRIFELIDGQQRVYLMELWYNDEIALPLYIPEDLGGGKVRSECPEVTREKIDKHMVWFMSVQPKTEEQIYNMYNRIQKGVRLTFGQDIRGHQGTFKGIVTELSKHAFIKYVSGREDDWELQTAGYLYLDLIHDDGVNKLKNFQRDNLTQFIEEHAEDEIQQWIYDACINRADTIQYICEYNGLYGLHNLQVISLSRCINKLFQKYPQKTQQKRIEQLSDGLKNYLAQLDECKMFIKLEKKPDNPFDERYTQKIKTSLYYPLALRKLGITESSSLLQDHVNLIWREFEKILEKNGGVIDGD